MSEFLAVFWKLNAAFDTAWAFLDRLLHDTVGLGLNTIFIAALFLTIAVALGYAFEVPKLRRRMSKLEDDLRELRNLVETQNEDLVVELCDLRDDLKRTRV